MCRSFFCIPTYFVFVSYFFLLFLNPIILDTIFFYWFSFVEFSKLSFLSNTATNIKTNFPINNFQRKVFIWLLNVECKEKTFVNWKIWHKINVDHQIKEIICWKWKVDENELIYNTIKDNKGFDEQERFGLIATVDNVETM